MAARLTPEDLDQIVVDFKRIGTLKGTQAENGRALATIKIALRRAGIEIPGPGSHCALPVNDGVFNTLTPASAYFIGLAITDGSVANRGRGHGVSFTFSLKTEDLETVEKFRDFVCPGLRIIEDRHMRKFTVADGATCLDLVQWGVRWRDKTHELGSCRDLFDEAERTGTLWHLIRGIVDGNGHIGWYGDRGGNTMLGVTGTGAFLRELQKRIDSGGSFMKGSKGEGDSGHELRYTGTPVVLELGEKLYRDKKDLFMRRKFTAYSDVVKQRELLEPSIRAWSHSAASNRKREG